MAKNKTTAVAVKEEVSEADIALCLNQRYDDATKTITMRTVVFGATLLEAEAVLQKRGLLVTGRGHAGEGLKGWLAEHCPNIDYSTAIRWKGLAFQMAQGLMSKDRKAVLKIDDIIKLIEGRDDEIEAEVPKAITAQRDALMAAPTVRKFVQQMFDFAGGKGKGAGGKGKGAGGRPKATDEELPKLNKREEAKAIWNVLLQHVTKTSVKDAVPLLPQKETQIAHDTLRDVSELLKAHLGEF